MDTKIIEKYGEEILCYRLRTARQKKRMQYKDFEKQLIALDKEHSALYKQKQRLGWEPLIPPVQKGWKRFFVLRADVAKSKQADFYQGILDKINTYNWSYRKDFLIKKRKQGRKIYIVKGQKLLEPGEHHFSRLGFSEKERQQFYGVLCIGKRNQSPMIKYRFIEPWRFVLRVRPNIIDRVRIRDEKIEARMSAIKNYIKRNDLSGRMQRLLTGNVRWKHWDENERGREINLFRNWPVEKISDKLKEQDI